MRMSRIKSVEIFVLLVIRSLQYSIVSGASFGSNHYSVNCEISFDASTDTVRVENRNRNRNGNGGNGDDDSENEGDDDWSDDMIQPSRRHITNKAPVSLFFHGGDLIDTVATAPKTTTTSEQPFVAIAECAFIPRSDASDMDMDYECYEDDTEDDDDDDDDQDDGHSSMLSNSSIRKRLATVSAGGGPSSGPTYGSASSNASLSASSYSKNRYYTNRGEIRKQSNSFSLHGRKRHDPLLLNVRGGAQLGAQDEFAKRLLTAAIVTLLYEGSLGHILEFLKIAMQTAQPGTSYMSIINKITSEKGIGGLWDGFIPWGVIQSVFKGGVFGFAHAVAKAKLTPLSDKGMIPEILAFTLAGGIAGGFQGFVLSPTLLLKTRVMTNPIFREKMSLWKTTMLSFAIGMEVVKNEGVLALMKGSDIFALKRVFDWSTRYFFSDLFESRMLSYGFGVSGSLSPKEKIAASLLGGTASTIVTLPLDVIVAKSQDAKKAGVKVSAWETFIKDYREGGWKGLYDANMMGFEARLLHVCLTTVVMKTGSGFMYNFLFSPK